MEHYAGIDVSLEQSSVCVVDATGRIVREAKVPSEPEALVGSSASFGLPLDPRRPGDREACRRRRRGPRAGQQQLSLFHAYYYCRVTKHAKSLILEPFLARTLGKGQ